MSSFLLAISITDAHPIPLPSSPVVKNLSVFLSEEDWIAITDRIYLVVVYHVKVFVVGVKLLSEVRTPMYPKGWWARGKFAEDLSPGKKTATNASDRAGSRNDKSSEVTLHRYAPTSSPNVL